VLAALPASQADVEMLFSSANWQATVTENLSQSAVEEEGSTHTFLPKFIDPANPHLSECHGAYVRHLLTRSGAYQVP